MVFSKFFQDPNTPLHGIVHRPLTSKVKHSLSLLSLIVIICFFYTVIWVPVPSSHSTESHSTESNSTESNPTESKSTESHSAAHPLHDLQSTATGFLPIHEAESLCSSFNWLPYSNRTSRRKIYDLVLVDTELDWLEIRMHEYQHEIDYFVIIEATSTFTQNPKPLHFKANFARFQDFFPKIIYRAINYDHFSGNDPWERE